MADKLKTASVLAFERKLDVSDALMFSGNWQDQDNAASWQPIVIREKSVRGTISNRLKAKDQDPTKLDAETQKPNLQTVDVAALPSDTDTLKVEFTLRVLPNVGAPSACNSAQYLEALNAVVKGYKSQQGLGELAQRYAANLASGRFLWRNRIGAEDVKVQINRQQGGQSADSVNFDALSHSLLDLSAPNGAEAELDKLSGWIEQGLNGQDNIVLKVIAFVRMGEGLEVYPSQELLMNLGRGDKSKTLYDVSGIAAIHSQKIGNALRTIDTWYPGADENGPIAVEPYGSVTTQGRAWRQPKKKLDFYNLLDGWVLKDKEPEVEQQHFVIATLIRGGVFGDAS